MFWGGNGLYKSRDGHDDLCYLLFSCYCTILWSKILRNSFDNNKTTILSCSRAVVVSTWMIPNQGGLYNQQDTVHGSLFDINETLAAD
jgi:hypothetical protein